MHTSMDQNSIDNIRKTNYTQKNNSKKKNEDKTITRVKKNTKKLLQGKKTQN